MEAYQIEDLPITADLEESSPAHSLQEILQTDE
jgi:hypothetical protein